MSTPPPKDLEWLIERAKVLRAHGLRLAGTSGTFHGINSRMLRQRKTPSPISEAIHILQMDSLNLQTIQTLGLLFGTGKDDATLQSIIPKLRQDDVMTYICERAAIWHCEITFDLDSGRPEQGKRFIERILYRYDNLDPDRIRRLKAVRNKNFAHVTLGYNKQEKVLIRDLWKTTTEVLSIVNGVALVVLEQDSGIEIRRRQARADGRELAACIRQGAHERKGRAYWA